MTYFGIDVHSKYSEICGLSESGEVEVRTRIATTEASIRRFFSGRASTRIVYEAGPAGPWLSRLLTELGHDVTVVNPRRLRLIAESTLKSDVQDAEVIARLSRLDLEFLRPVHQRSEEAQELRSHLRIRSCLVRTRVALTNSVKGILRAHGYRMRSCAGHLFVTRFGELKLPTSLVLLVDPLIETIAGLTQQIAGLDEELSESASVDPVARRLQTVPGVGPIISLSYMAWMDDPKRFRKSRDVGACLGLRPRLRSSADVETRGRISKEGDSEMRRLLVQAAHALLWSRRSSELKTWADGLAERIGRKKAVVAIARKLSVLLHRLWVTETDFRAQPA